MPGLIRMIAGLAVAVLLPLAALAAGAALPPGPGWLQTDWQAKAGAPASVRAIAQSPDGYLWVGTMTGLYRFDGISFEHVAMGKADREQSPTIDALLATRSGDVWVGHDYGGVSLIRNGHPVVVDDAMVGSNIWHILEAPDGAVWTIGSYPTGMRIARFKAGRWRLMSANHDFPLDQPGSFLFARDGTLWFTLGRSLYFLRAGSDRFEIAASSLPIAANMLEDAGGRIWLSDKGGLRPVLPGSDRARPSVGPLSIKLSAVPGDQELLFDRDGGLWRISRLGGVMRYALAQGGVTTFSSVRPGAKSLRLPSAQLVPSATLFDREGALWVGTELGLEQFTPSPFAIFEGGETTPSSWAGFLVLRDGLGDVFLQRGTDLFKVGPGRTPTKVAQGLLPRDRPCASPRGGVWIRTRTDRLDRVGGLRSRAIPLPPGLRDVPHLYGCVEDGVGRLWISKDGLGLVDVSARSTRTLKLGVDSGIAPSTFASDHQGRILAYVGRHSLWRIDGLRSEEIWKGRDVSIGFLDVMYQGPQYLLMGGPGGVARFDGRRIEVLSARRFPFLAFLSGIVQTSRGETWVQNAQGVVRIATADLERAFDDPGFVLKGRLFDFDDGLPGVSPYYNASTLAEDRTGRIWIATNNGIASADPASLTPNGTPPPVSIKAMRANGVGYRFDGPVSLPPGTTRVEIGFASPSLTTPKSIVFRYRLSGVDTDWVDAGAQREGVYTNLGPGEYRFHVIAANNDGVWNRTGAEVTFTIPPTFVQSRVFLALCLAAVILSLWLLYLLRARQIGRQAKAEADTRLYERERIARELHDTFLQAVQSLVLRFQLVANRIPAAEPAHAMMAEALETADVVIDDGRDRVVELRQSVSGERFVGPLRDLAERRLAGSGLKLDFRVEGGERVLAPVVAEEAHRIAAEAIFNSIRHAKATTVRVEILFGARAFGLNIADDGIGIPREILDGGADPNHFGLVGMKERGRRTGGETTIVSTGDGTRVGLTVPGAAAYRRSALGALFSRIYPV